MSLWKWNDVELEVDMEDVDFLEKYEMAFQNMGTKEKELKNIGNISGFAKKYCMMFWKLFDEIFGDGTSNSLFKGKYNMRICEECYDSFLFFCKKQTTEANKNRDSRRKKYKVKK